MPLPAGIVAAIEAGETLVTPSAQRAAAVREAWARRQLAAGRRVWTTPDVLPFDAFAERCLNEQAERGTARRHLLPPVAQQLLWRRVAAELTTDDAALLAGPERLAEALQRADGLVRRHGIPEHLLRGDTSPELRWLRRARARVAAYLDRRRARLDWSDEPVEPAGAAGRIRLAGFSELTPAQRRFLDACGGIVHTDEGVPSAPARQAVPPLICAARHPADELEQMARWCRRKLEAQPDARLLVVVPDLETRRTLVQRALLAELDPQALAAGRELSAMFAFEGGAPLIAEPRIDAHLGRLERLVARLDRWRWLDWLRSVDPGLGAGSWRATLEQRLLAWQGEDLDFPAVIALADLDRTALPEAPVRMLAACGQLATHKSHDTAHWVRAFDRALQSLETSPEALDSDAWQVRERWCGMLEEYAAAAPIVGNISAAEAWQQLRAIAQRTRFAPASPDVPVLVTAATTDPIVEYDGIWVAGLHDGSFPRPARLEGFLPAALQRASAVVEADPIALLNRAEHELGAWRARTDELVLSWAREDGGAEQAPSPLLRAWLAEAKAQCSFGASRSAADWLRREGTEQDLECWQDPMGLVAEAGAVIRGGVALLESANQCAFRAYAQWRLAALPTQSPEYGISASRRGRLLHGALRSLWARWRDQNGLRSRTVEQRAAELRAALEREARELLRGSAAAVERRAIERELSRAAALFTELIEQELAREPFAVLCLEQQMTVPLEGLQLGCRVDRVDRLAKGPVAIIDYKTGRAVPSDWNSERPDTLQLLAYRAAVENLRSQSLPDESRLDVAVLCFLQLSESRVGFVGVARDRELFGAALRIARGTDWAERTAAWNAHLRWVARRLRSGEATVEPSPAACRYCDLPLLCRRAELASVAEAEPNGVEQTSGATDGSSGGE